jgi:hypothetical protein
MDQILDTYKGFLEAIRLEKTRCVLSGQYDRAKLLKSFEKEMEEKIVSLHILYDLQEI